MTARRPLSLVGGVIAELPSGDTLTGSIDTLTTSRSIHGGSFNGSADVTNIIASTYGGTGNGFTKFSGPATSEKTFTLPNANDTLAVLGQSQTFTRIPLLSSGTNGEMLDIANSNAISGTAGIKIRATGATQKYWAIVNGYDAGSELAFRQSTANGGDPYASGTSIVRISATGLGAVSGTTASAANVFQSASLGEFLRSTSSLKYKTDVRDLNLAEARKVLSLRPVVYRSKAPADDGRKKHYGFIAEEVHQVLPALIHYDADGEPDAVQYERVMVAALAVIKDLSERVRVLESK